MLTAIHLDPGPNGYAVINEKRQVLARHLSAAYALELVNGTAKMPKAKIKGVKVNPVAIGWSATRLDEASRGQYDQELKRKRREWFGHQQGQ